MTVFDTDVLSEILRNNVEIVRRASLILPSEQAITVVTVEELLRGRLSKVRAAQGRREAAALVSAYGWLAETVEALAKVVILRDSPLAEAQVRAWREANVKVKPNDLRIAAIAVAAQATLVTRNRQDFALVPRLRVEFW
jgi:tRNA(fMet)-specific endonuclease VapC